MENVGYIKLHRRIMDSGIWNKPPEWYKLWTYILMTVNFMEDGVAIGSKHLKYEWIKIGCPGVNDNQIDSFIRWAKSEGMLTTQKTTRGMVLTVVNYTDFQQQEAKPRASNFPAPNQQTQEPTQYASVEEEEQEPEPTQEPTADRNITDTEPTLYNKKERTKEIKNNNNTLRAEQSSEIVTYGNPEINNLLTALKNSVGGSDFKESRQMQGRYARHLLNLGKKIGKEEFSHRLKEILQDDFKAKNCNKIAYLYGEMKSFIHSPVVGPKSTRKSY